MLFETLTNSGTFTRSRTDKMDAADGEMHHLSTCPAAMKALIKP